MAVRNDTGRKGRHPSRRKPAPKPRPSRPVRHRPKGSAKARRKPPGRTPTNLPPGHVAAVVRQARDAPDVVIAVRVPGSCQTEPVDPHPSASLPPSPAMERGWG